MKYFFATRWMSAAVTACSRGPAALISRQPPVPSARTIAIRIGWFDDSRRYSAAAKLFFTFCNSFAGTGSAFSFSSCDSNAASVSSSVLPSATSAPMLNSPAYFRPRVHAQVSVASLPPSTSSLCSRPVRVCRTCASTRSG